MNYSSLQTLLGAYSTALSEWSAGISSVMDKEAVIETSTNISGNSADRMRQYLNMVYSFVNASLLTLLNTFRQNFLLYTDAYYQQVDPADDTCIEEAELSEKRTSLQGKRSKMQQIGLAAENSVSGISDLVSLPSLDISEPDAEFCSVLTSIDDLDAAVNGLESSHSSADFGEIDDLISQLDAFITECCNLSKDFKADFTVENFVSLASVPGLLSALQNADNQLTAQESTVALAADRLEKRIEREQAEIAKREKQMELAKGVVSVVSVVATVLAVASGVGTLLVPVVCEMGKYAFGAAANEYVEHSWDVAQWDRANIGKEAIKGWFSGFTVAILPPEVGNVVKAGVSAANSALWGGLDNVYDQMTTSGTISETKSVFFDAAKSGTSSFAADVVGSAISDQVEEMPIGLGLDKYVNPSDDFRHYAGKFIESGVSKAASGIGERFTSTTVETGFDAVKNAIEGEDVSEGIDFIDRYKGVMSVKEISKDFINGGIKETVSCYYKEHTPDPQNGLTPIIQSKLAYETNPETGLTEIVQDSLSHIVDEDEFTEILKEMEEHNPSVDSYSASPGMPDYARTH